MFGRKENGGGTSWSLVLMTYLPLSCGATQGARIQQLFKLTSKISPSKGVIMIPTYSLDIIIIILKGSFEDEKSIFI